MIGVGAQVIERQHAYGVQESVCHIRCFFGSVDPHVCNENDNAEYDHQCPGDYQVKLSPADIGGTYRNANRLCLNYSLRGQIENPREYYCQREAKDDDECDDREYPRRDSKNGQDLGRSFDQ